MSQPIVRVIRVLEYVGPEDWVRATLQQSSVTSKGTRFTLASDRMINEIARTTKVVGYTPKVQITEEQS